MYLQKLMLFWIGKRWDTRATRIHGISSLVDLLVLKLKKIEQFHRKRSLVEQFHRKRSLVFYVICSIL